MITRWLTVSGLFAVAVLFASGGFGLLLLVKPHPQDRYVLVSFIYLLIGIILGAGTVVLWFREQLRLFNQTLRELSRAINEALEQLHPFYLPSINLPQNASVVFMAKPVRPRHPVYRVVTSEINDRYVCFEEEEGGIRITFRSNPNEAGLWSDELLSVRAALICSNYFGKERQIFVEELEAATSGSRVKEYTP